MHLPAGVVLAAGLGTSLAGCGGCPKADIGPLDSCLAPSIDAGPEMPDSGFVAVADYGIAVLPDAGPRPDRNDGG